MSSGCTGCGRYWFNGGSCGALAGGVLVISTFLGRNYENFAILTGEVGEFRLAAELVEHFKRNMEARLP
jgi:hypothetical protein